MKELKKEEQITVLKFAVEILGTKTIKLYGCCSAIIVSLDKVLKIYADCRDLTSLIPSFTRKNAFLLCEKIGFSRPYVNEEFWWDCGKEREARIDFLTALISDLEERTITYHREPTAFEIRFGEGATHYKDFKDSDVRKKNGELKKWVRCPYDGLRYMY